ncbi:hypothetical protein FH972_022480 [Carpinus fangiana]|uniref:DUF1753-domain-containing protein n=1 Tax=Carpinus fangiana TaxID=176857 RepID=A0A5N6KUM7_9ROSI|nr:hypothetical protein FH972_022480 [Carpinus fangiana]
MAVYLPVIAETQLLYTLQSLRLIRQLPQESPALGAFKAPMLPVDIISLALLDTLDTFCPFSPSPPYPPSSCCAKSPRIGIYRTDHSGAERSTRCRYGALSLPHAQGKRILSHCDMGRALTEAPQSFLGLMSLRTGTELIVLTIIFNKISGLYGLLALLTGFHLSYLQLSMYVYSLGALVLTATLAPHVRKQSPLQCLALAWFYLLDSLINATYTAAFGVSWFVVLAQHAAPSPEGAALSPPGGKMMDDVAGFTTPKYNVTQVDALVEPADGALTGQEGTLAGHNAGDRRAVAEGALSAVIFEKGSIASVAIISALWLVRLYFILVVIAYARGVLRQHIVRASQHSAAFPSVDAKGVENPFAEDKELGQGWRGKLGRVMVGVGRNFWLASDESGDWERSVGGRFSAHQQRRSKSEPKGVLERERRRRAGTGPSEIRPIELDNVQHK